MGRAMGVRRSAGLLAVLAAACATAPPPPAGLSRSSPLPLDAGWVRLPTEPYKGKQDDIVFVDVLRGWYGNGAGKVYRTEDGGASWALVWSQPGTFVRALGFVDARRGFLGNVGTDYYPGVTDDAPLYETLDGGRTWAPLPASRVEGPVVKGVCAIDVTRERRIFQGELREQVIVHAAGRVGGPGFVMRSVDGGDAWRVIDLRDRVGPILDVKFFDAQVGLVFAGTHADVERSSALILMTRDGGATWREVYRSTRPFELTWKASFPTREVGYVTIQSYDPDPSASRRFVAKTVDGGETWRELPLVDDARVRAFGVGFVDAEVGWIGTSTSGFETRDGGASWRRVELGRAVNKIRVVRSAEGAAAYAIGVEVFKLGGHSTGVMK
jgi:photosystem II stability/assembly factor-like uncharacterized protein